MFYFNNRIYDVKRCSCTIVHVHNLELHPNFKFTMEKVLQIYFIKVFHINIIMTYMLEL